MRLSVSRPLSGTSLACSFGSPAGQSPNSTVTSAAVTSSAVPRFTVMRALRAEVALSESRSNAPSVSSRLPAKATVAAPARRAATSRTAEACSPYSVSRP